MDSSCSMGIVNLSGYQTVRGEIKYQVTVK